MCFVIRIKVSYTDHTIGKQCSNDLISFQLANMYNIQIKTNQNGVVKK